MTAFDPIPEPGQSQIDDSELAMLRHDMVGALGGVVGGLSLIEASGLPENAREQFERASAAAKTLSALVRVLNVSGRVEPPATDLRRFIAHLRRRHQGEARERGLDLRVEAVSGLPDRLRLDPVALVRIADNLVGNALKFSGRGTVRLEIALSLDGGIRISVADEGPGVAPEALAGLLSASDGRPPGLGLPIVQRLAARLGGSLTLENRPTGGLDAVVRFPASVILPNEALPPGTPDLGGIRILLAEDNPTNQMVASQMLRSLRAEVTVCSDGVEALETFERIPVDLVVVDIEMPRMSGLEVIRSIRRRTDARSRIPIVALTAYAMREHRERIAAAGANGLISKPVTSVEALGRDLAAYVSLARAAPAPAEAATPAPGAAGPAFDMLIYAALADAIGPELMPELLDKVIADLLGAGRELAGALDPFDRGPIRSASHILISVAGALGAVRLQGQARALNNATAAGTAADLLVPDVQACLAGIDEAVAFVRGRLGEETRP